MTTVLTRRVSTVASFAAEALPSSAVVLNHVVSWPFKRAIDEPRTLLIVADGRVRWALSQSGAGEDSNGECKTHGC